MPPVVPCCVLNGTDPLLTVWVETDYSNSC